MSIHERIGQSDEWYTPRYVFEAMGARFDLDVAHPGLDVVDWVPADRVITEESLTQEWGGFVWMNPPFGGRNGIRPWLQRFMANGHGIALTPDRTSAAWWQEAAQVADAILFVAGKIKFIRPDGTEGRSPANGTTLFAKGGRAVSVLVNAQNRGLGRVLLSDGWCQ
jgi:hypothetical protein